MPNYARYRLAGGCYFFTVNLENRQSQLLTRRIDLLRDAVHCVKERNPFHIDACVVLPDHLHCIWTLPPGDHDFSGRWKAIKTYFSKRIPNLEQRSHVHVKRGERAIWQRRFWEHAIRDDRDYAAHVDYLHFNPIKHGWVERVEDWPYSTFHRFVEIGIYPNQWAGNAKHEYEP